MALVFVTSDTCTRIRRNCGKFYKIKENNGGPIVLAHDRTIMRNMLKIIVSKMEFVN